MDYKELKIKSPEELQKILTENIAKLRIMRFGVVSRQLKNVREIRTAKKENARILTLLHMQGIPKRKVNH